MLCICCGTSKEPTISDAQAVLHGHNNRSVCRFCVDAQVINVLAAQVIINNQDRCTKNFFMYQDPDNGRWSLLPWDLDGALGQDNSLGGNPGNKYCVLACEQWNR